MVKLELIDEKEAAQLLNLRPSTLRAWRCQGRGPNFLRLGGAVRYEREDLIKFIETSRISTSQSP